LAINTDVQLLFITPCAINDFAFVTIVEPLASWHAVQFTFIWSLCVWHPLVVSSFERNCVKFGALLCSEVGRNFGAILNVTGEIPLATTPAKIRPGIADVSTPAGLEGYATATGARALTGFGPWPPVAGFWRYSGATVNHKTSRQVRL